MVVAIAIAAREVLEVAEHAVILAASSAVAAHEVALGVLVD